MMSSLAVFEAAIRENQRIW